MSLLETDFFDEGLGTDMEFLDNTYYKLPFCVEDVHDLKLPSECEDFWNENLVSESNLAPGLCLSPTSTSSSSSNNEHQLLNERPDTPLMAVKFEDFSNGYNLDDFAFPNLASTGDDLMEEDVNIDEKICVDQDDNLSQVKEEISPTGSERVVDCSLSPSAVPHHQRTENVFTISKNADGNTTVKPAFLPCDVKNEGIRFSFSKDQPMLSCLSLPGTPPATTTPQLLTSDDPSLVKTTNAPASSKSETLSNAVPVPIHRFKVVPQSKLAGSTFAHKTHIQIPTSTLQTILKSGRLITRLPQQDGKVRIKTEPRSDAKHFVRIAQPPQSELPPSPPSSASSDGEGSSSPKSTSSRNGDSPCFPPTHIRVQPSGVSLAAQLLSSTQRFTQAHGPLILTEEEKRTLIAEGYSVPSKLPLTKNEEKSLKKIRRKIKNKLSAQESRRKKKEYVETLEKRMDDFNKENLDLKRKLDSLENSNRSLLSQLRSLQTLVAGKMPKPSRSVTTQTSSCLMVLVLCFAVFLGGWYPRLSPWGSTQLNLKGLPLEDFNQPSAGRIVFSFREEDHYRQHLCSTKGEPPDVPSGSEDTSEGSDTYDEPAGGGTTMNDTGDQKIVANTMKSRSAADVLASRKGVIKSSKMEVVVQDGSHDVKKKVVIASTLVTQ